ncbi:hypothetical protein [Beijerinckia mobilis]|uniref:hypothetical protein n=1 Tax=Beijerinckia mobilis TaxID=231434 RepID=UPI0005553860|nr:hypothetical protein [Beijerinckia mobilis]
MPTNLPPRAEPHLEDDCGPLEAIGLTLFFLGGCAWYGARIALAFVMALPGLALDRDVHAGLATIARSWLACRCLRLAAWLINAAVHLKEGNNAGE